MDIYGYGCLSSIGWSGPRDAAVRDAIATAWGVQSLSPEDRFLLGHTWLWLREDPEALKPQVQALIDSTVNGFMLMAKPPVGTLDTTYDLVAISAADDGSFRDPATQGAIVEYVARGMATSPLARQKARATLALTGQVPPESVQLREQIIAEAPQALTSAKSIAAWARINDMLSVLNLAPYKADLHLPQRPRERRYLLWLTLAHPDALAVPEFTENHVDAVQDIPAVLAQDDSALTSAELAAAAAAWTLLGSDTTDEAVASLFARLIDARRGCAGHMSLLFASPRSGQCDLAASRIIATRTIFAQEGVSI